MSLAVGHVLGDRYRLAEKIAAGGMGDVWRAEDTVLGRSVAVKMLRAEHAADPDFVERFRAEARHAAALSHPGIAAVYDYGETAVAGARGETTLAYLVMELVPGEPLSALLARSGPLSPERTLDLVAAAAEALQAAHDAGVIHRDVKPGNILLRPGWDGNGSNGAIALTDFGIARATNDPGHLTRSGLVLGTAYYLSPEQASGRTVTPASDLYSLGVVAYECLSGSRPFSGDSAVQVAVAHMREEPPPLPGTVPAGVAALVMRLLAKEPEERPASAAALAEEARRVRAGEPADDDAPATRALTTPISSPAPATTAAVEDPQLSARAARRTRWRSDAYPDQQRVRGLLLLVALLVIVLGAILLALLSGGDGEQRSVTDPRSEESTEQRDDRVRVNEAALLGRTYPDVAAELRGLGLDPVRRDLVTEATPGTVVGVDPSGRLPAESSVTVTVAATPEAAPDEEADPGRGKGQDEGKPPKPDKDEEKDDD